MSEHCLINDFGIKVCSAVNFPQDNYNNYLLKLTVLYSGVHLVNINIVNTLKIIFDV